MHALNDAVQSCQASNRTKMHLEAHNQASATPGISGFRSERSVLAGTHLMHRTSTALRVGDANCVIRSQLYLAVTQVGQS